MSRQIKSQGKKKRILLLCDGESEIVYSTLTISTHKVSERLVAVKTKPFKNLKNILIELKKLKLKTKGMKLAYEEIHLICDKEKLSNKSRQVSYQNFVAEVKKLQKEFDDTTLKIITSFPSFEFFLLLHFPLEDKEFKKLHNDKELIDLLSKQHKNYKKGDKKWMEYAIFKKDYGEKIKRAIDRAIKIKASDSNSWSNVFETVRQILNNSV